MAAGAPLEDARGLAQRYSRMRHEAEILVCISNLFHIASKQSYYCYFYA
jgi:hypothetical protein